MTCSRKQQFNARQVESDFFLTKTMSIEPIINDSGSYLNNNIQVGGALAVFMMGARPPRAPLHPSSAA